MITIGAYEKCKRYIEFHSEESKKQEPLNKPKVLYPSITLSRQTGAGADIVGHKLTELLSGFKLQEGIQWTYFDRNLIEKILNDHNLPKKVADYLTEDKHSYLTDAINEMLGIHPSKWKLLQKTTETIFQIARMGNSIIVGRGANVITQKLFNTFHVRLVSSIDKRIKHVQDVYNLSQSEAAEFIKKEDQARKDYLKTNFFKDIDDPELYHLIINTGLVGYDNSAKIVRNAVVEKYNNLIGQMN